MNIEQITTKIEKLLKLAGNNSNTHESEAAMLKAQKLMAEYNVEADMMTGDKIAYSLELCKTTDNDGFRMRLCIIIAENFRCKVLLVGKQVAFLGRTADAKTAKQVFEFAYRVIRKGIVAEQKIYRAKYGNSRGVSASYTLGFLKGLKQKFDEQCTALLIVTPPDVFEEFDKRYGGKLTTTKGGGITFNGDIHFDTYTKGQEDGRNFLNKKQVGSGN